MLQNVNLLLPNSEEEMEIISLLEKDDTSESREKPSLLSTIINGRCISTTEMDTLPLNRQVKRDLYNALSRFTGRQFPWGSLTGIRPTLVAREVESERELEAVYAVRSDKSKLAIKTARCEDIVMRQIPADSLYWHTVLSDEMLILLFSRIRYVFRHEYFAGLC